MSFTKNKLVWLRPSEKGLTLIECLVAIVVIAVTTAAIGPVLLFSVATRVQNQRTAQAVQLAQAEIDKVRLTVEQGGDYAPRLKELFVISAPQTPLIKVADVPAPNRFLDSTDVDNIRDARKVDLDGDGNPDFAVQLFRTFGIEVPSATPATVVNTPVAFDVGVRIYDIRAEANLATLQTNQAGLAFTSSEGQRGTRPLAVLYSQMVQGDRVGSLCQYWRFTSTDPTAPAPAQLSCN